MVCLQVIAILKEFNLKRCNKTKHKKTYEKYHKTYKKAIFKKLKSKYNNQKMMINFVKLDSAADLKDLYKMVLTLSKHEKVF